MGKAFKDPLRKLKVQIEEENKKKNEWMNAKDIEQINSVVRSKETSYYYLYFKNTLVLN